MAVRLSPFWNYFGGKYKNTPRYQRPAHLTIIEPFAGAAGYSLHFHTRNVILVEKYDVLAEIWDYLIHAKRSEIESVPLVSEHIDEVPSWVSRPMRNLIGMRLVDAVEKPQKRIGSWVSKNAQSAWNDAARARIASQVDHIRHWKVIHGSYEQAPDEKATWFIDPPYQVAGKKYVHGKDGIDFAALGAWCRERRGQTIVCENEGATWLPFRELYSMNGSGGEWQRKRSTEVVWTNLTL